MRSNVVGQMDKHRQLDDETLNEKRKRKRLTADRINEPLKVNRGWRQTRGRQLERAGVCLILSGLQALSFAAAAQTGAKQDTLKPDAATSDAVKRTAKTSANAPDAAGEEAGRTPIVPTGAIMPMTLNFQMWNNSVIVVDLLLDGKLYKGILDTGLSGCAITPAEAAALKLDALPSRVVVATLNETRLVPEVALKNLQFNAVKMGGLHVGLLDVSELYAGTPQPDAPALWLGTPFLQAFQITIDYPHNSIILNRATAPMPKDKGAVTLPLELRDGHIYTRVEVPGVGRFSALVDTGTLGTVVPASVGSRIKGAPAKTYTIRGRGGKMMNAPLITLPKIKVGTMEQLQVPALYIMPDTGDKPAAGSKPAAGEKPQTIEKARTGDNQAANEKFASDSSLAVLGNDFLRHYSVTINIARRKMTLTLPAPPADPGDPDADNNKKKPTATPRPPQTNTNTGVKKGRQ